MPEIDDKQITIMASSIRSKICWFLGFGALYGYYLYSYITLPLNIRTTTTSNIFLVYIISCLMEMIYKFIHIVYMIKYVGKTFNTKIWKLILPTNRFPWSFLKLRGIIALITGIWLCTIFIPLGRGCSIYENELNACVSIQIISVCNMVFSCFLALLFVIIFPIFLWKICSGSIRINCTGCCRLNRGQNNEPSLMRFIPTFMQDQFALPTFTQEDSICAVCIEETVENNVQQLQCGHKFHNDCIRSWVVEYGHAECPTCRNKIENTSIISMV